MLDQTFAVFTSFLGVSLAGNYVRFTSSEGEAQPFEKLSESSVVEIDGLLFSAIDEFRAVVKSLVNFIVIRLLSKDLVISHELGEAVGDIFISNFPPEGLRFRLANLLSCEAEHIHE